MSWYLTSFKKFLKSLGPGIISGGSSSAPPAIATFSQAGAQFDFGLLRTAIYNYPILIVIQVEVVTTKNATICEWWKGWT